MTIRRIILALLVFVGLAAGTPAWAVVSDATNLFVITKTGFVLNRKTNTYDTTVTIKNTASFTVAVPVQVTVSGLPSGVTLANAAGKTSQGSPYVNVAVPGNSIIPNAIITPIVLKFANPKRVTLTPKLAVIGNIPDAAVGLPPDPGEAGKVTVAGIDSNRNGVRDDVERWIAFTYPSSAKSRHALWDITKAHTASLVADPNSRDATNAIDQALLRAIDCLSYVRPDDWDDTESEVTAQILNTRERSRAYVAFSRTPMLALEATPTELEKFSCSFNPDALGD